MISIFTWCKFRLGDESKTVETFHESSYRYELGPVSDITTDKRSEHDVLEKPPVFDTIDDDGITTNCLSETDPEVVGCWTGLRSKLREMIRAIVWSLYILTEEISEMHYEQVSAD